MDKMIEVHWWDLKEYIQEMMQISAKKFKSRIWSEYVKKILESKINEKKIKFIQYRKKKKKNL